MASKSPSNAFARGSRPLPFVYGHRGTRNGAPENTLRAMRLALDQGADGIELDVRMCGSGEVVVMHDPDLMRVAGVPLSAVQAALHELRAHDLGQGERVPTLDEAMDLVLGAGKLLNIECKPDVPHPEWLVRGVIERVRTRSMADRSRVIFSSFSADICRELAARVPEVAVAFLFERGAPALPEGVTAVHPHHGLAAREAIAGFVQQGLVVNVWTVNDAARAGQLAADGVDGIITDDVPLVRAALGLQQ